jgi:hypothetical protein
MKKQWVFAFVVLLFAVGAEAQQNTFPFPVSGNVGIGTTNPTAVLQVVNPVNANGQVGFQVSQATGGDLDLTAARVQSTDDGNYIRFLHKAPSWGAGDYIDANGVFNVKYSGNVGIGTTTPGADLSSLPSPPASGTPILEVNGDIALTQNGGGQVYYSDGTVQSTAWNGVLTGGDYAESVNVSGGRKEYEPGDVLIIDPASEGNFLKSSAPYSTAVTGIYSTKPGVVGRRQRTARAHMNEEVPMAMTGIVPTKVSAENGPIKPGDLLVTSSKPGYAMKGTDRTQMLGAVIGKALGHLDSGVGVIEAVVTLQ